VIGSTKVCRSQVFDVAGGPLKSEVRIPVHVTPSNEELARQCRELQLIVDAIPAFVFYKDDANKILRVNRAASELLTSSAGPWFPDSEEQYRADLQVIASGEPQLGVVEPINVPGQGRRWFETARLPQFDENGRVRNIVIIAQDITDRKQLEDRLLQSEKLESIGRLAGGVAHDFNNLLTSIFGLIAVAQRELTPGSMAHEYLALLQLAAEGGANLTKQLLAFARRQPIEPQAVDLSSLVLETSNLLERVLGENIDVIVDLGSQPLPVKVDPNQISQVLLNLALNARDAMPNGGKLIIRTSLVTIGPRGGHRRPAAGTGRQAVLSIQDNGEGLSEEAREHLFEPFFTTKAFGKGTGLGLAMCYGTVKQNGGHIAVESAPGVGTTFTIYLPELTASVAPVRPPRSALPIEAGHETLLFVEDDDLVRHLMVTELARPGYRVIEASNGEEALKAAAEHTGPIHLLITDVVMPKMGGVELAQRFKLCRPQSPVLFISGYNETLVNGDPDVNLLLKPFTNDALLNSVRRLLDSARVAL
jgi:two-component system, cell cycle sensor histidine kinase and response regulator CckA